MKIKLYSHHHQHLANIGIAQKLESLDVPEHEYQQAKADWRRAKPNASEDELHTKAIGHLAWKYHRIPPKDAVVVHRWPNRLLYAIIALLILLVLFALKAHAQYSQIQTIQIQNQGTTLKTFAAPFKFNCSTNMTCAITGNQVSISASSTASTAWSSITAGTNSNLGIFAMSGNTLDLTGTTIAKLRAAAGLTASANGDIGQDTTTGFWHLWQNAHDRLVAAATNVGTAGQVLISNADGTGTYADPVVSQATASNLNAQVVGNVASAAADSGNPVKIGGVFNTTQPTVTTGQRVDAQMTARGAQIVASGVDAFHTTVDNFPATQPVSGTVTANAGTGTFTVGGTVTANQGSANTAANSWPVEQTDGTNVLGTATHPTRVDPTGTTTQPVSGTVTANIGTSGSLALDASVTGLQVGQASTTLGQKGGLSQGAVTTSAPTYTTAQTDPLSLTTAGALRVDGSGATQPVSGTVTANAGTGSFTVAQATAANLNATVTGTVSVNALPTGSNTIGKVDVLGNAGAAMDAAGQNATSPANELVVGAQFNTTPTTITSGNVSPLQLDSAGNLLVNIKAGAAAGGTSSNFNAAFPAAGTAIGVKNGTNMVNLVADASNNLLVNCATGCAAAGDQTTGSTALGALNAVITVLLSGERGAVFQLQSGGTGVYTVTPQCSFDGGTIYNANGYIQDPFTGAISTTATVASAQATTDYPVMCPQGSSNAQMKVTAYTSGTANWLARSSVVTWPSLVWGLVTTSAPSYTTGQINGFSLTTAGALRVDGSGATQPVSGTITANAGSGTFATSSTQLPAALDGSGFLKVHEQGTATVSGTVTANIGTTNGLALDASVTGLQVAQASTTSGQKGSLIQGAVTTAAPTYTTAQTDPLSLTTAGALRVDGSGVTQPVSGTVTANAGTGTFNIQANASVNVAQIAGSATSTAATGVQKVGIVGNAGAAVDAATGAAPPANAILQAGLASGATGGLLVAMPICDSYANINISTATTTLEVTGVSGRQVRICAINLVAAGADNVALIEGTGATCGTGTAGMAGGTTAATGWNLAANGGLTIGSGVGTVIRTATTGDSVCIATSAAVQLSGGISYAIY